MIYVGIDVAKDKHDCCIISSEDETHPYAFRISNDIEGFNTLLNRILDSADSLDKVKVGLEATGHYSCNIIGFLLDKGLTTYVINPLKLNLYRKSVSLRKTKTDRVDANTIASMIMSDKSLKSCSDISYHNEELKSLSRYRFVKVSERSKLKISVSRLVNILFPELENLVSSLHIDSVYAMLSELPGAYQIAACNLNHLTKILSSASHGRYGKEKAVLIRNAAKQSIGSMMPVQSMELQHSIRMIREIDSEIEEIESEIKTILEKINSPITSITGLGENMGAMILGEIGDFSRFRTPDQILAYAGLSPSTNQSGQKNNSYAHMEKRGSKYLRYALFNAAKRVCQWNPVFSEYLAKKIAEGKHYNVAISHAAKKLVRLIFALEKSGETYRSAAF